MENHFSVLRDGYERALLVGFFQTIGDLECLYAVQAQLDIDKRPYDVAPYKSHIREAIDGAVDLASVRAQDYSHVIVICGPCSPAFFTKFGVDRLLHTGLRFVGVNLTMVQPLNEWNPFDVLLERDSERVVRPDLTFSVDTGRTPVVATCFIEGQGEYGDRQRHGSVISTVDSYFNCRALARIVTDTRWPRDKNAAGLASPEQIISVLERTDALITNRLHGLVFGLKAGIPVVAIDAIEGGGKVSQQAACLEWPLCIQASALDAEILDEAIAWCQGDQSVNAVEHSRVIGIEHDYGLSAAFAEAYDLPLGMSTSDASRRSLASRFRIRFGRPRFWR